MLPTDGYPTPSIIVTFTPPAPRLVESETHSTASYTLLVPVQAVAPALVLAIHELFGEPVVKDNRPYVRARYAPTTCTTY